MTIKLYFLLMISVFFISQGYGQNPNAEKFDSMAFDKTILMAKQQPFKISLKDQWFGKDKADHFLVSAFLTAGSYYFLKEEKNMTHKSSLAFSVSFAFTLGLAKEIRDGTLKGNFASIKDGVADILGIGVAVFLFNLN